MRPRSARGLNPAATSRRPSGAPEFVEQRLRLFQILGIEAFGEPAVDRCEKIAGLAAPRLFGQQAGEADSGAQLEPARALLARNRKRPAISSLDLRPVRGRQSAQQVAP